MAVVDPEATLASMQRHLGFEFRTPGLLREALTHTSYLNERPCELTADNQRLEFLGDAVLDLLVAHELYARYPGAREGELTALRAALVRTDTVARVSQQLDLAGHLFLGRGEEASGGRERAANLCAALEALIGATYLDQGLEMARDLVRRLLAEPLAEFGAAKAMRDPKSLLQERVQACLHRTPFYRTVSESGPDHAKQFVVEVMVGEQVLGQGRGANKQAAEQAAAQAALRNPVIPDLEPPPAVEQAPNAPLP